MFDQIREMTSVMHQALDGLSARQRIVVNNIANADTPKFKASEVMFEEQLQEKLKAKKTSTSGYYTNAKHMSLEYDRPSEPIAIKVVDTRMRNDGSNVDIDLEMTKQAQTNVQYSAVAQMLAAKISGVRSVIKEGG